MKQDLYKQNSQFLQQLMEEAGISSADELSKIADVPQLQLTRLKYGLLGKMQIDTVWKVAAALKISVNKLVDTFIAEPEIPKSEPVVPEISQDHQKKDNSAKLESLKQEYDRLQDQLVKQRESVAQELQQESLQILESWLLQWPTATAVIEKNPLLPAERLLLLVKPVEQLMERWGLKAIATVGEELPYDPQCHELIKGTAEPGELVKIRYVGYKQGDKLLYRAKVSPVGSKDTGSGE
jgi:molecular chaperone GrpE (heat shock protein)